MNRAHKSSKKTPKLMPDTAKPRSVWNPLQGRVPAEIKLGKVTK